MRSENPQIRVDSDFGATNHYNRAGGRKRGLGTKGLASSEHAAFDGGVSMRTMGLIALAVAACAVPATWAVSRDAGRAEPSRLRMSGGLSIVAVRPVQKSRVETSTAGGVSYPHPRPRLAGFSPLIAITTSNKRSKKDIVFEHQLELTYSGSPIAGPPNSNYVIGFLDSGAVVDLAAGSAAEAIGLSGSYVTSNTIPIGGVGGTVDAFVSQPLAIFAAGLSAISTGGLLDVTKLRGHSNISAVVAPELDCGNGEALTAVVGTPFLSYYNSIINVDTPRKVEWNGRVFQSPDVQVTTLPVNLDNYSHAFSMTPGGLSPVSTASYFPDLEDLETPIVPTMLSLTPLSFPTGAVFFSTVLALQGEPGPTNLPVSMRMMVDTGAQSSIISPGIAAQLNLPFEPDFVVDVCGVGGLQTDVPGYYIDYVRINALGGLLEFSRTPFVVLDLQSPEGGPLDGVLGMNFFWNRNVAFEPSLTTSGFFDVSDPVPFAYADFDLDFDVDRPDASLVPFCMTGPVAGAISPECTHVDHELDDDVDLRDFSAVQRCFGGEDVMVDVDCAD